MRIVYKAIGTISPSKCQSLFSFRKSEKTATPLSILGATAHPNQFHKRDEAH